MDGLIRRLEPDATFLRGDCNADNRINIADGIALLVVNFAGDPALNCRARCDANGDGETSGTSDAIWIFSYRFGNGPPPGAPFPACEAVGDGECEQPAAPCT